MKMTELLHSMEMLGSRMDSRVGNLEIQVGEGFEKQAVNGNRNMKTLTRK